MLKKILLVCSLCLIQINFVCSQEKYSDQTIEGILELPEKEINLAIAKLVIDQMVNPSIDINHYLATLDEMIVEINKLLGSRTKSMDKMLAIKTYLFDSGEWNDNQSYVYDLSDPLGRKIENKLLPNFIESKKGNCVSMPFLFLILGKKMEIDVVASTAPLHIFVRFKKEEYYKSIFTMNMQCFKQAESLGWREPSKEFDQQYLQMVKEEQNKKRGN